MSTPTLPSRVSFLLETNHRIRMLWDGRGKTGGDDSRSGYDFAFAVALLRLRVTAADVIEALPLRPNAHRTDAAYVKTTVESAMARLGRQR